MKAAALVLLLLLPLPLLAGENPWTQIGPAGEGSLVYNLVFAPGVPGLAYAATSAAGVLRSTDGGRTWTPANAGLVGLQYGVHLAVAPGRPRTLFAFTDSALFKSVDAGRSWARTDTGLPVQLQVTGVAVSPVDAETVYALVGGLLFRSTDGGGHWAQSRGPSRSRDVAGVAVDPRGTVYATVGFGMRRLYRSADRGDSWSLTGSRGNLTSVIPDPQRPGTLYGLTYDSFSFTPPSLIRSTDSGSHWKTLLSHVSGVTVDPTDPNRLYASDGRILYSSQDGGVHWTGNTVFPGPSESLYGMLAVDPAHPQSLLVGIFLSGIYRSDDFGRTWRLSDFPNVRVTAVTSLDRRTILAGGGLGIYRTKDGGATWERVLNLPRDVPVTSFAVEPGNPGTIYAGTRVGLYKSVDGGNTWGQALLPGGVHEIAVDPANPRQLFVGGAGLSVSGDRGRHWTVLAFHDEGVTHLVLDPRDPRTFYITLGPVVGKTVDGGNGWRGVFTTPDGQSLTDLDVAPGDPRFVYAASRTGIFRSANAGEAWALFASPPEQFTGSLVVHPSDPGTVYASSRLGVFRNTDGEGWVPVAEGLSGLQVFRLTRDRTAPDRLLASVEKENGAGAGLFAYEIVP